MGRDEESPTQNSYSEDTKPRDVPSPPRGGSGRGAQQGSGSCPTVGRSVRWSQNYEIRNHTAPPDSLGKPCHLVHKTSARKVMMKQLFQRVKTTTMASFPMMLFVITLLLPSLPIEGKDPDFSDLLTTQPQVQREIVNKHNELRRAVDPTASNMLKMEWSIESSGNAQKWANRCTLEHSPEDERKTSTKCGENLFMSSDPTAWSTAIQSWFNENQDFSYGVGPKGPNAAVGHYTQLVWYSSFKIGCGVAYCPNQDNLKYFYVCQYCPAGNNVMKKSTPYQQGPPCSSCPNNCDHGLCTNSCEFEDLLSNCASLKNTAGCGHELLLEKCKATCLCEDKIH